MLSIRMPTKSLVAFAVLCLLSNGPHQVLCAPPEGFRCDERFSVKGGSEYDMSALKGLYKIESREPTPPTTTITSIFINPCEALTHDDSKPNDEQCPDGTRACLIESNEKNERSTIITKVIPLAGDIGKGGLDVSTALGTRNTQDKKSKAPLLVTMHGGMYNERAQSVNITFECDSEIEDPTEPSFQSYDFENGILSLNWKSSHACPLNGSDNDNDNQGEAVGFFGTLANLIRSFFMLLIIGLFLYFVAGAIYRWKAFGSRGSDLIPHRDFWRDAPYLLRDLFRPRDRSGYSSLS